MNKHTGNPEFAKIAVLGSPVEAALLESVLQARRIPYVMVDYTDSVYDGIFRGLRGWGHVEAPTALRAQILEAINEVSRTKDEAGTATRG